MAYVLVIQTPLVNLPALHKLAAPRIGIHIYVLSRAVGSRKFTPALARPMVPIQLVETHALLFVMHCNFTRPHMLAKSKLKKSMNIEHQLVDDTVIEEESVMDEQDF